VVIGENCDMLDVRQKMKFIALKAVKILFPLICLLLVSCTGPPPAKMVHA
jgi:hypothetical protein